MYIIYEGKTDPHNILYTGDWSNGMIGVSKTFGGSSILSSPARGKAGMLEKSGVPVFLFYREMKGNMKGTKTLYKLNSTTANGMIVLSISVNIQRRK